MRFLNASEALRARCRVGARAAVAFERRHLLKALPSGNTSRASAAPFPPTSLALRHSGTRSAPAGAGGRLAGRRGRAWRDARTPLAAAFSRVGLVPRRKRLRAGRQAATHQHAAFRAAQRRRCCCHCCSRRCSTCARARLPGGAGQPRRPRLMVLPPAGGTPAYKQRPPRATKPLP